MAPFTKLVATAANNRESQIANRKSIGLLHLALAVLFLGPVVSPLFRATGLPLLSDAGLLARDLLSAYVCPTPDRSYALLGFPMAVCARCWGATVGLLLARTLFRATGRPRRPNLLDGPYPRALLAPLGRIALAPLPVRLLLCALPFLLWPLEIAGAAQGWWYAPLWLLLLNGAQAGFFAGIFFCSIWKGLSVVDDRSS